MIGLDRYIGSITLTSANNTYVYREGATVYTRTIAPGTYWLYDAADFNAEITGLPSFYRTLKANMGLANPSGNSYEIKLANLLGEGEPLYRGLVFNRVAGALSFGFDFSNANFKIPKSAFGFPDAQNVNVVNTGSFIRSPQGVKGHWIAPRKALSKISYPLKRIETSTEEVYRDDAYQIAWQSYVVRLARYQWIPAQYVHASRSLDPTYTQTYQTLLGDTHIALQNLWESNLSTLRDVIILHDVIPSPDAMRTDLNQTRVEIVRLFDANLRGDYEACVELSLNHGEQYNVSLPLVRRPLIGNSYASGGYQW